MPFALTSRRKVNNISNVKKKVITLGVRVEEILAQKIRDIAEQNDRSVSWVIRNLILAGLQEQSHTASVAVPHRTKGIRTSNREKA